MTTFIIDAVEIKDERGITVDVLPVEWVTVCAQWNFIESNLLLAPAPHPAALPIILTCCHN